MADIAKLEEELKKQISDQVDRHITYSEQSGNTLSDYGFRERFGSVAIKTAMKKYENELSEEEQKTLKTALKHYIDSEMVKKWVKSQEEHPRKINDQFPVNVGKAHEIYEQTLKEEKAAITKDIEYLLEKSEKTGNTPTREQAVTWLEERIANDIEGWNDEQGKRYIAAYTYHWLREEYDKHLADSIERQPRTENGTWPWKTKKDGKGSDGGPDITQTSGSTKDFKSKAPFSSNYVKTYQSFSGHDMVCTVEMPLPKGGTYTQVVGELQTITYSIHQEKTPIRCLGDMNAKGYVFGPRTIAGTLIFTVFDRHWAANMEKKYLESADVNAHMLADELPPLNITISCANEYGYNAVCSLFGVTLVNEGQVMSINDVYTENTYQFYATDVQYLAPVESTGGGTNKSNNLSNINANALPSSNKPTMQVLQLSANNENDNSGVNPDPSKPKKSDEKKYKWKNQQTDDSPLSYKEITSPLAIKPSVNYPPGTDNNESENKEHVYDDDDDKNGNKNKDQDKNNDKNNDWDTGKGANKDKDINKDDKNEEKSKENKNEEKDKYKDKNTNKGADKDKNGNNGEWNDKSENENDLSKSQPQQIPQQNIPSYYSAHMLTNVEYDEALKQLNNQYEKEIDEIKAEESQGDNKLNEYLAKQRARGIYADSKEKIDRLYIKDIGKESYRWSSTQSV